MRRALNHGSNYDSKGTEYERNFTAEPVCELQNRTPVNIVPCRSKQDTHVCSDEGKDERGKELHGPSQTKQVAIGSQLRECVEEFG